VSHRSYKNVRISRAPSAQAFSSAFFVASAYRPLKSHRGLVRQFFSPTRSPNLVSFREPYSGDTLHKAVRIEKISAVTFRVTNMKASVQFYRDVLGMELVSGGEERVFLVVSR
jgi:hypothetical protein